MNTLTHVHIYDWHAQGREATTKSRGLVGSGGDSLLVEGKGLAHIHTYMHIEKIKLMAH